MNTDLIVLLLLIGGIIAFTIGYFVGYKQCENNIKEKEQNEYNNNSTVRWLEYMNKQDKSNWIH